MHLTSSGAVVVIAFLGVTMCMLVIELLFPKGTKTRD